MKEKRNSSMKAATSGRPLQEEGKERTLRSFWKALACTAVCASLFLTGCGSASGQENSGQEGAENGGAADSAQGSYRDDVSTADLQQAVAQELGEDYWPNMDVPEEMLEDTFGLAPDLYEEITAQTPMISANVDTLVIVKAKEGSEQQVEDALNAYKEYNTTEALQYPMNMGKVQAAQIKSFGRYVCFVQLGAELPEGEGEDTEESDAAAIEHCEQANAKALAAIEDMLVK